MNRDQELAAERLLAWKDGHALDEMDLRDAVADLEPWLRLRRNGSGQEEEAAQEQAAAVQRLANEEALRRDLALDWVREHKADRARQEAAASFAWTDIAPDWDAEVPPPQVLARTDGQCAFYLGRRNGVPGASESGKTWLVVLGLAQEIRAGRPAVLFDAENGPQEIRSRLRAVGLRAEQAGALLRYKETAVPLPAAFAAEQAERIAAQGGRLVVFDAVTEFAQSMGLDLSGGDTNAVEEVYAALMDPWTAHGFAAVVLDNTPKGSPWDAAGSQHKKAGLQGSQVACAVRSEFGRATGGYSDLVVRKDRPGHLAWSGHGTGGDRVRLWGRLHVEPLAGGLVDVRVEPPPSEAEQMVESMAAAGARADATFALAAAAVRSSGEAAASMSALARRMDAVRKERPGEFGGAHWDRAYVTDALFPGGQPDHARAAAHGLVLHRQPRLTVGGKSRTDYRVALAPDA